MARLWISMEEPLGSWLEDTPARTCPSGMRQSSRPRSSNSYNSPTSPAYRQRPRHFSEGWRSRAMGRGARFEEPLDACFPRPGVWALFLQNFQWSHDHPALCPSRQHVRAGTKRADAEDPVSAGTREEPPPPTAPLLVGLGRLRHSPRARVPTPRSAPSRTLRWLPFTPLTPAVSCNKFRAMMSDYFCWNARLIAIILA